jgi:hypothetical protein
MRVFEIVDREYWEGLLAEAVRERENYNGMHQLACLEIARLREALEEIVRVGGQDLCRGIASEALAVSPADREGK